MTSRIGGVAFHRTTAIILAMVLAGTSAAQSPEAEFAGWTATPGANGSTSYTAPGSVALVVLGEITATGDSATVAASFARGFSAPALCPSLAAAQPQTAADGRVVTLASSDNGNRCAVVAAPAADGRYEVGFALETATSTLDAQARMRRIVTSRIGPVRAAPAPAIVQSSGSGGGDEAALKAALAAVPKANRPLALVSREATSMSGMFVYTVYRHWMVFANGYATDSHCYDWDPAVVSPTPAALRGKPYECRVVRWRKVGTRYQFDDDEDGSFKGKDADALLSPFKPGERIAVALGNVSGSGSAPAIPGIMSVSSMTSGELKMTMAGDISVGSWTSVVVSGNGIGGGSSNSQGPAIGRYLLDGFLIAIATKEGGITRGFIGQVFESRQRYIYLNGTQYYEPDK